MKQRNSMQTQAYAHAELILKVRLTIALGREDLLPGLNEELKEYKSNK